MRVNLNQRDPLDGEKNSVYSNTFLRHRGRVLTRRCSERRLGVRLLWYEQNGGRACPPIKTEATAALEDAILSVKSLGYKLKDSD